MICILRNDNARAVVGGTHTSCSAGAFVGVWKFVEGEGRRRVLRVMRREAVAKNQGEAAAV